MEGTCKVFLFNDLFLTCIFFALCLGEHHSPHQRKKAAFAENLPHVASLFFSLSLALAVMMGAAI